MMSDESHMAFISVNGNALHTLIVNEVPAFDQTNYYFCNGDLSMCFLGSNASIGGTHPYYRYDSTNHTMVQAGTATISASSPSDYFDTINSGEFELEQRS